MPSVSSGPLLQIGKNRPQGLQERFLPVARNPPKSRFIGLRTDLFDLHRQRLPFLREMDMGGALIQGMLLFIEQILPLHAKEQIGNRGFIDHASLADLFRNRAVVFQQVFQQMGLEMNGVSRGLLNAGNMISRYSALFLVLAVVLIGCILFFSLTEKGHTLLKKMVTHLPVFREIPVAMDYSRLTQGLSLGLRSGLSPETTLDLTKALLSQPEILEKVEKTAKLLEEGEAFSKALTETGLFSGMEGRLITVSFYSGSSDETFKKLSLQYTEKSVGLISQAVSVVEPTIVILLSLLVGLVLLSVMMPLLGILSDFAM